MVMRLYGDDPSAYAIDDGSGFLEPAPGEQYDIYLPPVTPNTDPSVRVTTGLKNLAGTDITFVTASSDAGEKAHLKFYGTDLPSDLYYKVGTKFFVTHSTDIGARLDAVEAGFVTADTAEATTRASADTAEATARAAADTTETAARIAGDATTLSTAADFTTDSLDEIVNGVNPLSQYPQMLDGTGAVIFNGKIIVIANGAPLPPVVPGAVLVYGSVG